jgi:serine/threonine protein kinase
MREYQIIREIDRGAQGIIYLAQTRDGREVVLKQCALAEGRHEHDMLNAIYKANDGQVSYVVRCFEGFEEGGSFWLVEEVLGEPLGKAISCQTITPLALVHVASDTARAIAETYKGGIVHCDVTPWNFCLSLIKNRNVLIDFASATLIGSPPHGLSEQFSAPEVLAGSSAPSSDSYSWGRLMEFLLTGMTDIGPEYLVNHMAPWVDRDLAELVRQCTEESPRDRPCPDEVARRVYEIVSKHTFCRRCHALQFVNAAQLYPCCVR